MKKIVLALAAAAAFATPAMANEARVEARGGIAWDSGSTEDIWGIAAGYDFDLGSSAFAGLEVAGDKLGVSGTKVSFSAAGRLGAKLGEKTKLYADAGYGTEFATGAGGDPFAGVGVEHTVVGNVYGKLFYRHYFVDSATDVDGVGVGVGVKF